MGQDPSTIREQVEQTRERMGDTVDALAYKADVPSRTKESVQEKVDAVKGRLGGVAGTVNERTPDGQDVKQGARRAAGLAQENPLGLAIGAVAVGFLAGMLVPGSRVENEKIGPLADQVKDQARETVQTVAEHGKDAAQDVVSATADAAKEATKDAGQEHAEQARSDLQDQAESVRQRAGATSG